MPALPVASLSASVDHYVRAFGFAVRHQDAGFAIVVRDDAELHLWEAGDVGWRDRADPADRVVHTGAESFIAGTASCRIEVAGIDDLLVEYQAVGVLYDLVLGRTDRTPEVVHEPWGVRDFHTVDLDGNLLTFYERDA